MIGFSFMHIYGILCFIAVLFLAVITIISAIEIGVRLIRKRPVAKRLIVVFVFSLAIIGLNLIPYRYAQSLMIRNCGLPNDVKAFFQQKALEGDIDNMKILLKRGFNAEPSTFSAALYNACFKGHINVIEFSLQNGANINEQSDDWKTSPLMIAAENGQVETTKLLLSHGANPHLRNKNGETALDVANKYRKKEIVDLLAKFL